MPCSHQLSPLLPPHHTSIISTPPLPTTSPPQFYFQPHLNIFPMFTPFIQRYHQMRQLSVLAELPAHLNTTNTAILAVRLQPTTLQTFPTYDFLATYFTRHSNPTPPDTATWPQWIGTDMLPSSHHLWSFLSTADPISALTIVSAGGYVIFSSFGTASAFAPHQAQHALSCPIWQLSPKGTTISQCETAPPLGNDEIVEYFHQFYVQHHSKFVEFSPTSTPTVQYPLLRPQH